MSQEVEIAIILCLDLLRAATHTRMSCQRFTPSLQALVLALAQKSFLDKDTPPEEMIRGLLDCMPMGAKTVTVLGADSVKALADGGAPSLTTRV